ncbi:MAG: prephenate dehydrogenase/arogenate dehydrogenase family protein [Desulfovibrio sp.]|nr:prephenate dehydrogenase/arogenate dehydrogenase family protein [Desulfovibrio sp.]
MTDAGPLPKKTVIVGAKGRMGAMLDARCRTAAIPVVPVDRPLAGEHLPSACEGAELALLCVPAAALDGVLETLCRFLPADCVLADITSVKVMPMDRMERRWQGPVVGTHPLFGPNPGPVPSPHGEAPDAPESALPVAIVPGTKALPRHVDLVEAFLRALGFGTFRTTAMEHDKAMSLIQGMNFITSLAYFAMLAERPELLHYVTPSFRRRLAAAEKLLTEDAELFAGLFDANPFSHEAVREFRKMLNVAAAGDVDLLCARAQWWWREGAEDPPR